MCVVEGRDHIWGESPATLWGLNIPRHANSGMANNSHSLQNSKIMSTNSNAVRTKEQVAKIIAKRRMVTINDVGSTLILNVQGNGNLVTVKDKAGNPVLGYNGQPLTKWIYNLKCNSMVAIANKRNQDILKAGIIAEQAGDEDKAIEFYRDYLNKTQVSFSYIGSRALFVDGHDVKGTVSLIETENGQLLTLDEVKAVPIAKASMTPAFSLSDLLGDVDAPAAEDVFADPTAVTAPDETAPEAKA